MSEVTGYHLSGDGYCVGSRLPPNFHRPDEAEFHFAGYRSPHN